MIVFDVPLWMVLSVVASALLPLVVGFVTTRTTDPALKAVLLAALALASQLLIETADALQHDTPYNLGQAMVLAVVTFAGAVAVHYGGYKPTRVADKMADIGVTDGRHEA